MEPGIGSGEGSSPMSSTATLESAPTGPRTTGASRHLPLLALVVAGASAVLSVVAITTNNGPSPATPSPVVVAQAAAPAHVLDVCGHQLQRERLACW